MHFDRLGRGELVAAVGGIAGGAVSAGRMERTRKPPGVL
jgi:hypothetical protein